MRFNDSKMEIMKRLKNYAMSTNYISYYILHMYIQFMSCL